MSLPSKVPTDAWMDAHIEAYVDGTLSPEGTTRFEAGLQADPRWKQQVERARDIRAFLRAQSPPSPPPELTHSILKEASGKACLSE